MSWLLVDLLRQVKNVLLPINGGNGSTYGEQRAVVKGLNSTGSSIPLYTLVEFTFATNTVKVRPATTLNSPDVVGVVVGYFDGDEIVVEAAAPDGSEVAVQTVGVVLVLIESAVTRGEYAFAAATDGTIYSSATAAAGAIGRVIESADIANIAYARVAIPLTAQPVISASASFGTPSLTLSTSNAAGSGTNAIRTNATIAAFDATVPVTQAFSDAAATGSAGVAARRDHKHGMPASPSVPSFATPAVVLGSAAAAGAAGTVIRSDSTIAAFDTTVPVTQAMADAAATGSAAFAARRDHKHGMPSSITQAQSHDSPDTDSATSALHHTLGTAALQAAAGNHSHGGGSGTVPIFLVDAKPSSAHADDNEFDDNTFDWTEFDPGSVMATPTEDAYGLKVVCSASSGAKIAGAYRAWPGSGDWTATVKVDMSRVQDSKQRIAGMMLMEDATNSTKKINTCHVRAFDSTLMTMFGVYRFTDYQTFLSSIKTDENMGMVRYLRIRKIGTGYWWECSGDGIEWKSINGGTISFTPAHIGVFVYAASTATEDMFARFRFYRVSTTTTFGEPIQGRAFTF